MRAWIRRNSFAYSMPLLVLCTVLLWSGRPRTVPAASDGSATEPSEKSAQAAAHPDAAAFRLPVQLMPSGGPYISPDRIRAAAFHEAAARGVESPRVERVLALTYREAAIWNRSGSGTMLHPDREVYVASVQGNIVVGHHARYAYSRSYYVFDATTGQLTDWGATNSPEPDLDVRDRER